MSAAPKGYVDAGHYPVEGTPVRIVDGPYLREHRVIGSVVRPHDPKYVRVSVLAPDLYGHGHVYLDLLPHEIRPVNHREDPRP